MVFVNIETAADNRKRKQQQQWSAASWLASALVVAFVCGGVPTIAGQTSPSSQTGAQAQDPQNIPDAPSVQPPTDQPAAPSPIPKPEEKKTVERDPWTNQPINKPPATDPGAAPGEAASAPPPMPPVRTVPPG